MSRIGISRHDFATRLVRLDALARLQIPQRVVGDAHTGRQVLQVPPAPVSMDAQDTAAQQLAKAASGWIGRILVRARCLAIFPADR